jgi:hypothetical protein
MLARHYHNLFNIAFWIHKKSKSVYAPHEVWGKLYVGAAWFLIWNLLQLLHFSTNCELNASVNCV